VASPFGGQCSVQPTISQLLHNIRDGGVTYAIWVASPFSWRTLFRQPSALFFFRASSLCCWRNCLFCATAGVYFRWSCAFSRTFLTRDMQFRSFFPTAVLARGSKHHLSPNLIHLLHGFVTLPFQFSFYAHAYSYFYLHYFTTQGTVSAISPQDWIYRPADVAKFCRAAAVFYWRGASLLLTTQHIHCLPTFKSQTSHWATKLLKCPACTLKGSYVGVLRCWTLHATPRIRPELRPNKHICPWACHSFVTTHYPPQLVSITSCRQAMIETAHHIWRPHCDACLTLASTTKTAAPSAFFSDHKPGPRRLVR